MLMDLAMIGFAKTVLLRTWKNTLGFMFGNSAIAFDGILRIAREGDGIKKWKHGCGAHLNLLSSTK